MDTSIDSGTAVGRSEGVAAAFTPLTWLASFAVITAAPASGASPPSAVKERTMMEAMEREDRPVVREDRSMVESVTAPATPSNTLDRRDRLH
jgi:hypothetical protein